MKERNVKNSIHLLVLSLIALAPAASLLPIPAQAADQEESQSGSTDKGQLDLAFRYRYELVDQASEAKDAHASTLRTRLAYRSPYLSEFGFQIEFDDIRTIGNELYDSTRNGISDRPVVADPEGTDVNQALVLYRGVEDTQIGDCEGAYIWK